MKTATTRECNTLMNYLSEYTTGGSLPCKRKPQTQTGVDVCEHVFPNVGGPYLHTIIGTTQR